MTNDEAHIIAKIELALFDLPLQRRGAVIHYFAQRFRYVPMPTILDDVLDEKIANLDLSIRSANCLESQGIMTVGDLLRRSDYDLLSIRNFGRTSFNEVRDKLFERGLRIGMLAKSTQ